MTTFHEFVHICTVYVLLNQVTNHYAFSFFNLGQAQVRRKAPPQESNSHLDGAPNPNEHINQLPSNLHQQAPAHRQHSLDEFQINHHDNDPKTLQLNNHNQIVNHPKPFNNLPAFHQRGNFNPQNQFKQSGNRDRVEAKSINQFAPRREFQPIQQDPSDGNFKHHIQLDYLMPLNDPVTRQTFHKQGDGIRMQKSTFGGQKRTFAGERQTFAGERQTFGGQRQTFKHFRYSRIRRYYTLSTASMTTWKRLNYTTRLMYSTPNTPTTRRFTDPYWGGSSRQTLLHTRMTESDEVGKDLFVSGSIEYRDDSFDKPPTAMIAYDSLQMDSAKNASTLGTPIVAPAATTPTQSTPKTTKKTSIELISLESSSEEKPSSSEAKEEESSPESVEYGNEKLYGEYGYNRKYNYTMTPIVIDTYANIREVPGFEEFNLTSAEVAFWEANASWIMDKYFPSSEYNQVVSNYSEENLVRSFFLPEYIDPQHLDFYKWYYKLLTNPERLHIIYNRTVLEEPDYKNLSQYTPFAIPEDLQRYYMFINQKENEIEREKKQEEYQMKNDREAEQNIDKILGVGGPGSGKGVRPLPGEAPGKIPRRPTKVDPDVSQILEMIDNNQQSDSLMREDDSSDGFIDMSRYKRDVSKFEPD